MIKTHITVRENSQHIETLTVLRGLAALLVVLSHCLRLGEPSYFGEPRGVMAPFRWVDLGTFGVVLFFVLSGFTLYVSYGDRAIQNPVRFIVRRIFRIYPAYLVSVPAYLAMIAAVSVVVEIRGSDWIAEFVQPFTPRILAAYLTLSFNFTGDWFYINSVYWSLPIEFQFYLLFPLFILLLRVSPFVLVSACIVLLIGGDAIHGTAMTFHLAWQFACGMLAALAAKRIRWKLHPLLLIAAVSILFIVAWLAHQHPHALPSVPGMQNPLMGNSLALYYGLIATLVVFVAALGDWRLHYSNRLWRAAVMQGEISYSLYLYHNLALLICYGFIVKFGLVDRQRSALIYGVGVPLAYLLAWISYRIVEKPGIDIGKNLAAVRPAPLDRRQQHEQQDSIVQN